MNRIKSTDTGARATIVLLASLSAGGLSIGCQTSEVAESKPTDTATTITAGTEDAAPTEVVMEEVEGVVAVEPTTGDQAGNQQECTLPVVARSPHAVANPCLTTNEFIRTISALDTAQKEQAMRQVAAAAVLQTPGNAAH